jgi:broad-specificity NMP kinase
MALKKKQREFLTYLEKTMGVVTPAVKNYGLIVARTHYKWYAECEEYRKAVDEIRNVADDFVESKLMKLIQDGDTKATIFYAKTRLKGRGYVERIEQDINMNANVGMVSEEAVNALMEKMEKRGGL